MRGKAGRERSKGRAGSVIGDKQRGEEIAHRAFLIRETGAFRTIAVNTMVTRVHWKTQFSSGFNSF